MDLLAFVNILRRRVWLLLLPMVATFGTVYLGSEALPDFYEVTARFALTEAAPAASVLAGVGIRDAGAMRGGRTETELPNRVALASVRPLIERTIWKLQVRDAQGRLYRPDRFVQLARLSGRPSIRIEQVANTRMIRIRARSRDPEEAAQIANTLATLYMDDDRLARQAEYRHAAEFIESQIETVRADYLESLVEIREFQSTEGLTRLDLNQQAAHAKLVDLRREHEATIVAIEESRARLAALRDQLAGGGVPASVIAENRHIERLQALLVERESQMASMMAEKRAEHPDVLSVAQAVASLKAQLDTEIEQLPVASARVHDLEQEIAAGLARQQQVAADIDRHLQVLGRLPDQAFIDAQLQLRHNAARDLYFMLMQTRSQIGIAESMTLSNLKLVEHAVPPAFSEPAGPKRGQMRTMGLFMGFLLGIGLVFMAEQMDDRIRTPEDATAISGLPVLGAVPRFRARKRPLILHRKPTEPISEAYHTVISQILQSRAERPIRTLLVTSPLASEGKTTTVANLGIAAARMGRRVVLVDADLRRPRLHVLFGLDNATGLATLEGDAGIDAALQEAGMPGLWVLPSGRPPSNPGQFISSGVFGQVMHNLRDRFDLVIIDSPPVLAVHDAILLAGKVDASVSVLEHGKETRRALILEKQRFAHSANDVPIGIVINKYNLSHTGYYAYGYQGNYR